jgi:hypothetical protein
VRVTTGDDLLPSSAPHRPARRPSQAWLVVGALTLVVVLVVALGAMATRDDKSSQGEPAAATHVRGTTPHPSSALGSAAPPVTHPDTSSTAPTTTSTSTRRRAAASTATPEPSVPDTATPPPDSDRVSITTSSCSWDPQTQTLSSAGTVVNRNRDGARVEITVTWYSRDGTELNAAATQDFADGTDDGSTPIDWSLDNGSDQAPEGLRCDSTVQVIN